MPDDFKQHLTPQQYEICFLKQTEPAFSGEYLHHHAPGTYCCVACGQTLFASDTKFDSGTGWPSFWADQGSVQRRADGDRTEIVCGHCQAHLGHVFNDGPAPSGLRYCVNSLALRFKPAT